MRHSRTVQTIIFDFYSPHEHGRHLQCLSELLDENEDILRLLEKDLIDEDTQQTGRDGLSVDSVFRCLLLKQILGLSYEKLSFQLSDSPTYRSFARLARDSYPGKSSLQGNIRRIKDETLKEIFEQLATKGMFDGEIDVSEVRIDSTAVKSNIAPPSDSQLLNDGVRVLSRMLGKSQSITGTKVRFKDHRKKSKSLSYRIFQGKKPEKDRLYVEMLDVASKVMGQVERGREQVRLKGSSSLKTDHWLSELNHYYELTQRVIDQTKRRVLEHEKVAAPEKIVSMFEEHTDIIVKGNRDIDYGHKVNLASDARGLLTSVTIEQGNPADTDRYVAVLEDHERLYGCYPNTVVADGGYASLANLAQAKERGIKRAAFHKKKGLTLSAMGMKKKTWERLRNFRAGIEGNISELKRAFGMAKALWKKHDGFKAYVWASVLCYNLNRLVKIRSG